MKNSILKRLDILDEKYAVSEKITKTWKIKIAHKMMYWNGSLISELNKLGYEFNLAEFEESF